MESLLRRARSTRDTRWRALPRDQQQQEEQQSFSPFTTAAPANPDLLQPYRLLRRSRSTVARRFGGKGGLRGGGIYGADDTRLGSELSPQQPTMARRKSISSTRESQAALGLPESWNPPITANNMERKRRVSIFFGLAPPLPTNQQQQSQPKRTGPPPSIRLYPFPPRAPPSRHGSDAKVEDVAVAVNEESCVIGVALGSPSEGLLKPPRGVLGFRSVEPLTKTQKSPAFLLPPEPFGVTAPPPPPPPPPIEKLDEPPKTAGWKRVFGKTLFGRRSVKATAVVAREATPDLPPARVPTLPEPPKTATSMKSAKLRKRLKRAPRTPCLDVDIPQVEMERYSVMFGNLLPPSEKSSLFARRRSRDVVISPPKITTTDTADNDSVRLYRLTESCILSKSVDEMLQKQDALSRLTTNSRSPQKSARLGDDLPRTSPAPPSPGSLTRSFTIANDGRCSPMSPRPCSEMVSPALSNSLATHELSFYFTGASTPAPVPSSHTSACCSRVSEGSVASNSSSNSTSSSKGSYNAGDDNAWMLSPVEPAWEMVTPLRRPATAGATMSYSEDEIAVAAQISIARQISLSQRQLLIPVVPKCQRLVSRRAIRDPPPLMPLMKPRLVDHKVSAAARRKSEAVAAS